MKETCSRNREETTSNDGLSWDLEFSEHEIEPEDEGKLLCPLVRKTYLRHLKMCLWDNYEHWLKNYGGGMVMSDVVIAKCAADMEKKALRACLLVSRYQRSVVKLIKHVKKSTESKKLHEALFSSLNSGSKWCDKSIQTEICEEEIGDTVATTPVTEIPLPLEEPKQPSIPSPLRQEDNFLTSASCFETKYNPDVLPFLDETFFVGSNFEAKVSPKRKSAVMPEACIKKRKSSCEPPRRNLEERLKKFEELFGGSLEASCDSSLKETIKEEKANLRAKHSKFFLLVNWKSEAIAQICELNKRLLAMSELRRSILQIRFDELFGPDDPSLPVTELTHDQFTHCRKRTATLVVSELTPFFETGRISSREIFKSLAKEVTRIILSDTYAPGMEYIHSTVAGAFENDRHYVTLEDVVMLASQ